MKKIKMSRVLAVVLAIAMMFGLATTAFAAEITDDTFTMKVNGKELDKTTDVTTIELGVSGSTELRVVPAKGKVYDYTYAWTVVTGNFDLKLVAGSDNSAVTIAPNASTAVGDTFSVKATVKKGDNTKDIEFKIAVVDNRATAITKTAIDSATADSKLGVVEFTVDKSKVTNATFYAIYASEKKVALSRGTDKDEVSLIFNGYNLPKVADDSKIALNFTTSRGLAREERKALEAIAAAQGVKTFVQGTEYAVLDTTAHGTYLDTAKLVFQVNDTFADKAAAGTLKAYTFDGKTVKEFGKVDLLKRSGNELTLSVDKGEKFIITDKDLVAAAASSKPASSKPAESKPSIPNTGDNNVVAVASVFAVIALAGAAVVAKKATK